VRVSSPFRSRSKSDVYRGLLVYDQYYASLAASSQPTPVLETGGSDFGEEEEDVKPSIEYLNSLNEYRKRSRSTEDVGFSTSNSGKKVVKLGYDNPASGPIIASATPLLEALVRQQPLDVEVPLPQGQDPIVYGTLSFLPVFILLFPWC